MSDKPLAPNCSSPFRAQQPKSAGRSFSGAWSTLGTPCLGSRVGKEDWIDTGAPPPHTHWPRFPFRSSPVPGRVPTAPPARQSHSPAPPGGRAPSVRVYARRGLGLGWMPLGLVGIFFCCCCCLDLNIFFCFVFCFVIFFVFLFLPFMIREGDGGRFH